ncbi:MULTISPECIES: ATP-binding protein [Chryseobacterium]|uniref:ATP-binding protein n=1 Tax=Chryseobacterium timonianum TaxID=1805473 RepID=UPI00083B8C69|nr:ATP-binding protein [Chryseobacterium timonianum]
MKINPNSSIRSGYKYEDLFTLKLIVDWLLDPEKYENIRVQYKPDDVQIRHFAIDDIVATRKDGTVEYYQIKHKQNPDTDLWTFDELIDKGLNKWINSFHAINQERKYCSLITNGNPDKNVQDCIVHRNIDLGKVKEYQHEFFAVVQSYFSNPSDALSFFENFEFQFGHPNKRCLEDTLRNILYKQLKVTKGGVNNLLLFIGDEGSEKFPTIFTLDIIRNLLEWDNPRPLNQNFNVPTDFEFFDRGIHQILLRDISTVEGGIKVIVGKPGSGKSTYLSKLYSSLEKKGAIVFRHHYHLNPKDVSYADRLNSERVIEGLKAEFKKQDNDIIKSLGEQNTAGTQLKEFIDQVASYCREVGRSFILIIDGLDHVIREGNSQNELIDFLNEVLFPQQGYWLILGTQEIATHCFPNSIRQLAPKDEWIEIKGLKRDSVKKIACKSFPQDYKLLSYDFDSIVSKLIQVTGGNPLHLRYVLTSIENNGRGISRYDLDTIPHYNNEIEEYYQALWQQLTILAKTMAFALTVLDFKLQEEQVFSLAADLCQYPQEISENLNQIRHLFRFELSGISVYHNSFLVFIQQQKELKEQKKKLYKIVKEWLNEAEQREICWSELPKVEYYLGNPGLLLSIDNEWVIKHYLDSKDEEIIENILYLASKAAFENNVDQKIIYFSLIYGLFKNRSDNLSESIRNLWLTSFKNNKILRPKYPNFSTLTDYQLKEMLIALKATGIVNTIPDDAVNRVNELFTENRYDTIKVAKCWLEILAHFESTSTSRVFNFIEQFRDEEKDASHLFKFYLQKLLDFPKQPLHLIDAILKTKLEKSEKIAMAELLILDDLKGNLSDCKWKKHIQKLLAKEDNLFFSLYKIIYGENIKNFKSAFSYYSPPPKINNYSSEKLVKQFIKTNVLLSFINCINDLNFEYKCNHSSKWLSELDVCIFNLGKFFSQAFREKSEIDLLVILKFIENLRKLHFNKDHDIYDYERIGIPYFIDLAIWLSAVINKKNQFTSELNYEQLLRLGNSKRYNKASLLEIINSKIVSVNRDEVERYIEFEIQNNNEMFPFPEIASFLTDMAQLSYDFGNQNNVRPLLENAASNILAYGHHKDMLLYNILESIEICIKAGSSESNNFLLQIFPYVFNIEALTDGDETRHFMNYFCDLLAKVNPQLLYNLFFYNINMRDYTMVENIFDDILSTLDFQEPIAKAVGKTAIGPHFQTLCKLQKEQSSVQDVIESLQLKFGLFPEKEEEKEGEDNDNKQIDQKLIKITPENLKNYMSKTLNFNGRRLNYDDSYFLQSWITSRLHKYPNDRKKVVVSLKEIIDDSFSTISANLLDLIYEISYEIDREFAFLCICWASSNGGVWAPSYRWNIAESRKRWRNIIDFFPERIEEYYQKSVTNTGLRYGLQKDYVIPVPKSTQFHMDCGRLQKAENVTQDYLDFLPHIFPNVKLDLAETLIEPIEVSNFDILMARLTWLSPIVRAQAAEGVTNLLKNDNDGCCHEVFFEYLKFQDLENAACEGLIILINSLQDSESLTFKFLTQETLNSLLSIRCMATDLLLKNIAGILKFELKLNVPLLSYLSSGNTSLDEEAFRKIINNNLTNAYIGFLDYLQRKVGDSFIIWKIWCTKYEDYCTQFDLKYDYSRDDSFATSRYSLMIGRTTIFGDILKSTFMHVVDALYNLKRIEFFDLWQLTLKNLPVDYSILKINLEVRPEWWFSLNVENFRSFDLHQNYSQLLINWFKNSDILFPLYYNATYSSDKSFYGSTVFCQFKSIAIAIPKNYDIDLDPEMLFDDLENRGVWDSYNEYPEYYGFYEGKLIFTGTNEVDLVLPLVKHTRVFPGNIWQYYRMNDGIFLLSPTLMDHLELDCISNKIQFKDNRNNMVAFFGDFLYNFNDTSQFGEPIPYNSYLMMDKGYLNKFLGEKDLKLAVILRQNLKIKDSHSIDEKYSTKITYDFVDL